MQQNNRWCVVFLHGILSSGGTWNEFLNLLKDDRTITGFDFEVFEYPSPLVKFSPRRRIPDLNDLGVNFGTYLQSLDEYKHIVLVTHSQGGLVVQRFLHQVLTAGRGQLLHQIEHVIHFACPNNGSEYLRSTRRWFRNPQEVSLRVLNREVLSAQATVINRVVNAKQRTATEWRIPVAVYAGIRDNIVPFESATSVFPDPGALPGGHSSIIKPKSRDELVYRTLRREVLNCRQRLEDTATMHEIESKKLDEELPGREEEMNPVIEQKGSQSGASLTKRADSSETAHLEVTASSGGQAVGINYGDVTQRQNSKGKQ